MTAEVTFDSDDRELVVRVVTRPSIKRAALLSVVLAALSIAIGYSSVWWPALIVLALLVGLISFLALSLHRVAELRVSEFELVSKGHADRDYGSIRRVLGEQCDYLEYQESTDGPESSGHPEGLYAVVGRRSICLLPGLNEPQTANAIDRIYEAFPDYRLRCQSHSVFGQNFTSLNLNRPGEHNNE